jgi:methionyl-tRNA formyltransferase
MIRAVAPPIPGAFIETQGRRVLFTSSRLTAEPACHPHDAPCLYASEGRLYLDCRDGVRLLIGGIRIDDAELTAAQFQVRFGTGPWRF